MGTISLRRLSDATIKKYEQLEAEGKLTDQQRRNWESHKAICRFSEARESGDDFHTALARAIAPKLFKGRSSHDTDL